MADQDGYHYEGKPRLIIDFDGVLHTYEKGWHDGTIYGGVFPGAKHAMEQLHEHFSLVIHSCRCTPNLCHPTQVKDIQDWLRDKGIPFDEVWAGLGKPLGCCYLDDQGLHFHGWASVLQDLMLRGLMPRTREKSHGK